MSPTKIDAATWRAKIEADLKGKPFEKLIWHSPDGLDVQPFYVSGHDGSIHPRKQAAWQITEPVDTLATDHKARALKGLEGGATAILLDGKHGHTNLQAFSEGILTDLAPILLRNVEHRATDVDFWKQHAATDGHAGIDPMADIIAGRKTEYDSSKLAEMIRLKASTQARWGILSVDGSIFKNSGGSIVDDLAFTLSALQEHLHQLKALGYSGEQLGEVILYTATGTNFFFEIAKLRALRQLAYLVAQPYAVENISLLAESDSIHSTQSDMATNILRLSTMGMSAALGGADFVALHPHEDTEQARRIARNIQHLLIEESYFDKNLDPVAGSYYLEQLTRDLKEQAWAVFLQVEQSGGFLECLRNGFVQNKIAAHLKLQRENIAKRKAILLGVNQYPNLQDVFKESGPSTEDTALLKPVQLSEPFEALRIRMQARAVAPKAFLLQFGQPLMRKARATYAFNFLACAGIHSVENTQPDDLAASLQELKAYQPDIIVLCSDNDSWDTLLPNILPSLPTPALKIMAGKNNLSGFDYSIFEGCDVLGVLGEVLLGLDGL
jgi:methylmalonyl-CoA mutase